MATVKSKLNQTSTVHRSGVDDEAMARLEQLIEAGLCSNCRHLSDCVMLLKTATPVIQCEMFECGPSLRPRLSLVNPPASGAGAARAEEEGLLGLCTNCDHLNACRLPKPLGGVWQCEEYA